MYKEIIPESLDFNAFSMISKDWLLITAEKEGKVNTMTASWGGVGVIWGKPVAYIFVRPQRFTKEFIDFSEKLSLSVLPNKYRKELNYLGTVSGRDEEKIEKTGLLLGNFEGVPYFEAAETVLVCRKLYAQELKEECFLNTEDFEKWYPEKDYHTMYVVEIEKVLKK